MTLKQAFIKVGYWRLATFVIALLAVPLITLRPDFTRVESRFEIWHVFDMWANFDGQHYLDIADYWYGVFPHTDKNYAFFPIYPALIRGVNLITQNSLLSGLIISNLAFVFALFYLFKLLKLDYSTKISNLTVLVLLFFPTSFFFGSYYTESVFLLISVLVFYLARQGKFLPAAFMALIGSATRITGVFLWPALALEFYLYYGKYKKKLFNPEAIWLILPPLGLLSYVKYQFQKTGDALYFITSQPAFGAGRTVDKIILIHQVLFRYAKMLIFVDHSSTLFFSVLLESLSGVGFLALIIYGLKKLRISYLVYVTLSFFLPTFTGTFSSMPRYVMVLFPLFALFATVLEKAPKQLYKAYFIISSILAIITIALFTRGYFIG